MKNMLEKFKKSGLVVKIRTSNKPAIIGGTESTESTESTECGEDITLYKNAFSISSEPNEWIIELPGKGQMIVTKRASTLEEAVSIVCHYFHKPSQKRSIVIPTQNIAIRNN